MRLYLSLLATLVVCAAQEPPNFRVSVDLVPVTAVVTGRDGQPVVDMRAEEFILLDNGKPRPVQYLWREVDLRLTIGLVVDVSGSQMRFLGEHRQTIAQFLGRVLRPQDQAFLVAVGAGVKLVTDLTHSVQDLQAGVTGLPGNWRELTDLGEQCPRIDLSRIETSRPGRCGGTLLWNGIYSAGRLKTKSLSGRKALLVLTDGLDAGSSRSLTDAIEAAQAADTVVYTIDYPSRLPAELHVPKLVRLIEAQQGRRAQSGPRRISEQTGGRAYKDPGGDPAAIFAEIERELRSLYVLAFATPENARDGKFHTLEVKSKRRGLTLRARRGYVASSE